MSAPVWPQARSVRAGVLRAFAASPGGATDGEVARATNRSVASVAAQRRRLVVDGWLEDGRRRRTNPDRSTTLVWVLTVRGRQALAAARRK